MLQFDFFCLDGLKYKGTENFKNVSLIYEYYKRFLNLHNSNTRMWPQAEYEQKNILPLFTLSKFDMIFNLTSGYWNWQKTAIQLCFRNCLGPKKK